LIRGIGVDILEIKRMEKAIRRHSNKFQYKIFTANEWEEGMLYSNPSFLAGRFAVKEAVVKVLDGNWEFCRWREIEVLSNGKPYLKIYGKTRELAEMKGITSWYVTLSHTKDIVVAVVIAEGNI